MKGVGQVLMSDENETNADDELHGKSERVQAPETWVNKRKIHVKMQPFRPRH